MSTIGDYDDPNSVINEALSIAITSKRERADERGQDPALSSRYDREADAMDALLTERIQGTGGAISLSRIEVDPVVLLYAFRYSLGRRTYAVSDVARLMIAYRDQLRPWRQQVHDDIEQAITNGFAGDLCDVEEWRFVQIAFAEGENPTKVSDETLEALRRWKPTLRAQGPSTNVRS